MNDKKIIDFKIKTQKELYEECSAIFEKSYSVKSNSDESLSCDGDDDECLAVELMRRLTPAMLSKLRRSFKKGKEKKRANDIDRRVEEVMRQAAAEEGIEFARSVTSDDPLWLDEDGFVTALDRIFGHHKYTTHSHKLFQLLDSFCTGKVRWRQLVDRLVAVGAKKTSTRVDAWSPVMERRVERLEHCKRETIVKLVSIERDESFCFAAVSRGGRVGVYTGWMQLIHTYEDVQYLILSASDRSLTVYDAATVTHTPIYCITGLPNIATCLAYTPTSRGGWSELALGGERGDVTRILFLQPRVSLFYTRSSEHTNNYFWMELSSPPHTSYCSLQTWRRVHCRSVRRIAYLRDGDIIVSCSHDSTVSVRLRQVAGKLDDYVFKVQRGVTCFHVVPSLHLLATGSGDGVVRLWETTQPTPFATLTSPGQAAVLDVAVVAAKEIVIGYCSNCWLHIWDLYEECLLQTIKVKFPFLGVLGKKVEFGAYCIHPGPTRRYSSEDEGDEDNNDPLAPALEATTSRRPSSVYHESTGGLILQVEETECRSAGTLEDDKEYKRFNRPDVLLTCCDYVCVVELSRDDQGIILAPPGDTLKARRPSYWDLPDDIFQEPSVSPKPPASPAEPNTDTASSDPAGSRSSIASSTLLTPAMAEYQLQDLDTLLENAGLQGILEKDFVLMRGLKYDLNRKLADMKENMTAISSAVSMGAPYLAARCCESDTVLPGDEMMDRYRRIMRLFPAPSLAGTPTTSNSSTPRKKSSNTP